MPGIKQIVAKCHSFQKVSSMSNKILSVRQHTNLESQTLHAQHKLRTHKTNFSLHELGGVLYIYTETAHGTRRTEQKIPAINHKSVICSINQPFKKLFDILNFNVFKMCFIWFTLCSMPPTIATLIQQQQKVSKHFVFSFNLTRMEDPYQKNSFLIENNIFIVY